MLTLLKIIVKIVRVSWFAAAAAVHAAVDLITSRPVLQLYINFVS